MATLNQLLIAEATEYEFKSAVEANKPRSWLKTVSAFANGVGGSIYFSVSDDSTVVGLDSPQQAAEQISELIKARVEPAIKNFVLEPLRSDGKDILRLQIYGGANTPYYYTGDGSKTAYYRIGNISVQTPAAVLNELLLNGLHQTFDVLETKHRASSFRSTEQSFVVVLPNLDYNKTSMPNDIENGIDYGIEKNDKKILSAVVANPRIMQKKLAIDTGLSVRTVARELKHLRNF